MSGELGPGEGVDFAEFGPSGFFCCEGAGLGAGVGAVGEEAAEGVEDVGYEEEEDAEAGEDV